MKEKKTFFNHGNKLNKGYGRSAESRAEFSRSSDLFLPLETIEFLENHCEGAAERLITIAEKEQAHRHAYDLAKIKVDEKISRLTRICDLIFVLIISYFSLEISQKSYNLALFFFIAAFLFRGGMYITYYFSQSFLKKSKK